VTIEKTNQESNYQLDKFQFQGVTRQEFIKKSVIIGAAATGIQIINCREESKVEAKKIGSKTSDSSTIPKSVLGGIQRYRELGKTGLYISDIGFGTGDLMDPNVVLYAINISSTHNKKSRGFITKTENRIY
jgi:hypothetical protein